MKQKIAVVKSRSTKTRLSFLAAFAAGRAFPACSLLFVALMVAAVRVSPVLAEVAAVSSVEQGTVHIVNNRAVPTNNQEAAIWVSFSGPSIDWGSGCEASGYPGTVKILPSRTCEATVPSTNTGSRFCASPIAGSLNCSIAQQNHQTLIETNFQPNCFKTKSSCIWYDISVIPFNSAPYLPCTDCAWNGHACPSTPPSNAKTYCAKTGDVAFNLPVQLSCSREPTYICRGPLSKEGPGGVTYGEAYPKNCGNPNATCACGSPGCPAFPHCVAAYFYPMFSPPENAYQPNAVCPNEQILTITFTAGQ
jgi:hypothetical protein